MTPFLGLLHFTLDVCFIMLRVKQGGIKEKPGEPTEYQAPDQNACYAQN